MSLPDLCSVVYALVVDAGPLLDDLNDRCDTLDVQLGGAPRETPRSERALIAAAMGGAS